MCNLVELNNHIWCFIILCIYRYCIYHPSSDYPDIYLNKKIVVSTNTINIVNDNKIISLTKYLSKLL